MTFLENKIPPPVVGLLFCVIIWAISTLTYVLPVSIISQQQGLVIAVILLSTGLWFCYLWGYFLSYGQNYG